MQGAGAVPGQFGFEAGADRGVGAGELQGVDGALHVQTGAADQDGRAPLGEQPVDLPAGEALVLGDAGRLGDVPDVQQAVRHAVALGERQLGGPDVHAPVELHRVGVDHLAVEPLGEEDPQIRLSGGRGADDGDDARGGGARGHRTSLPNTRALPDTAGARGVARASV